MEVKVSQKYNISRRRFMRNTALGALGMALAACKPGAERNKIETLEFGRSGHKSTRILFGAYALSAATQEKANETLALLLDYGINHIDTAPSYGVSERRLGPWMAEHRQDFFLATKTDQRTYKAAQRQIRSSLERLQVDHVDLLQLHNLVEPWEWEAAMGPDGALKAVEEARDQGLTRFIGVTGHGLTAPAMHTRSLERFDFESVLLPINYPLFQNEQYMADVRTLLDLCEEREVAVQTIKSVARGPWKSRPKIYNTWYEPLDDQAAVDKAVHWILGQGPVFINSAGDPEILSMTLEAGSRFRSAPSDEEMQQMVSELDMQALWS
jgi:predicted aldo/keto reductase-like oxidoreductase